MAAVGPAAQLWVHLPNADDAVLIEGQLDSTLEEVLFPVAIREGFDLKAYAVCLYFSGVAVHWHDTLTSLVLEELCLVPVTAGGRQEPRLPGMHLLRRVEAIAFLRAHIHRDGVYLLRPSETSAQYVLSLTHGGELRHFRVASSLTPEGCPQHQISNRPFPRLTLLLQHYTTHPLCAFQTRNQNSSSNSEGKATAVLLRHAATAAEVHDFMQRLRRPFKHHSGDPASEAASAAAVASVSPQLPPAEPAPTRDAGSASTTTPPATDAAAGPGGKIGRNVFYEWARQPAGDGNDFYYNIVTRERVWERPADFPGDVLVIAGGVTTRIPRAQAEARMRSLLNQSAAVPQEEAPRRAASTKRTAAAPVPPERPPQRPSTGSITQAMDSGVTRQSSVTMAQPRETAPTRHGSRSEAQAEPQSPPQAEPLTRSEQLTGAQTQTQSQLQPSAAREAATAELPTLPSAAVPRRPSANSNSGSDTHRAAAAAALTEGVAVGKLETGTAASQSIGPPPPPPPPGPPPLLSSTPDSPLATARNSRTPIGVGGERAGVGGGQAQQRSGLQHAISTVRLRPVAARAPLPDLLRRPTGVAAAIQTAMDMRRAALRMLAGAANQSDDEEEEEAEGSDYDEWAESDVDD